MLRNAVVLGAAIGAFLVAPVAAAAQQGKKAKTQGPTVEVAASVSFSVTERRIITEYFAGHRHNPQPLPPGIAKNLARGKPLPPGIAKQQLPDGLVAQLSRRAGVEVAIFGDRVVLLEASGLVVDVLEGVFR
ncbi:MAG: anti-virulence regulator CigR family protein [Gemmatimonadota bacterium]|nr:anti-virulence regulator CigR family protein [Gemmatimonadota bacterium]MDH3479718.1 anti-virulence regulator CigR family protein [Gemmatimonadota bacterium]MDH3569086.1 anti-virulence regulator CigR family protein [Gemmatimonadota bacterium]MDH5551620.1 anti-virulence regulator CigR family protein [Gemmatimonadota bacterium]